MRFFISIFAVLTAFSTSVMAENEVGVQSVVQDVNQSASRGFSGNAGVYWTVILGERNPPQGCNEAYQALVLRRAEQQARGRCRREGYSVCYITFAEITKNGTLRAADVGKEQEPFGGYYTGCLAEAFASGLNP